MFTNDYVRNGLFSVWHDYDRHSVSSSQIVVTQEDARYLTNFLAILIALTIPSLFIIFVRALIKILSWIPRSKTGDLNEGATMNGNNDISAILHTVNDESETGDLDEGAARNGNNDFSAILHTVNDESDPLKAVKIFWEGLRPVRLKENNEVDNIRTSIKNSFVHILSVFGTIWDDPYHGGAVVLAIIICLAIWIGITYLSIVSASVASISVVLSDSPDAGLWELNPLSRGALLGEGPRIAYEKQHRAWKYRANCYDKDKVGNLDCNTFYHQHIKYKAESNVPCPFDGDVCALGATSAFKADTGLTDSNVLGVNAPAGKRFWFQHSLTCAPLLADERYVKSEGQEEYPGMWEYYYGVYLSNGEVKDNQTFYNTGDWSLMGDWMPDYSLSFVFSDPTSGFATFDPLSEFRAGNKTVTILFISTGGPHLHLFKRDDPIFPAKTRVLQKVPGGMSTFWRNNSTKAGILGCVDWYQVCTDSTGSKCWDMVNAEDALEQFQDDIVRQQALYLVLVGLNHSNTWYSINYQRANILNATAEIAQVVGIHLAKEQWKVEAENIFKGTLAYIQLRVFDFARGTYAHFPDMVDHTDPRVNGIDVGRMYKFRNGKYINVSAFGFWGGIVLCFVLIVGSFRFSDARRARKAEARGDKGYHNCLWIFIMLHFLFWLVCWPFQKIWTLVCKALKAGTKVDSDWRGNEVENGRLEELNGMHDDES